MLHGGAKIEEHDYRKYFSGFPKSLRARPNLAAFTYYPSMAILSDVW